MKKDTSRPLLKAWKKYTRVIAVQQKTRVKNIEICGKTGAAENPHGEDHSIFIAFTPKTILGIAIAVCVENGGWGQLGKLNC